MKTKPEIRDNIVSIFDDVKPVDKLRMYELINLLSEHEKGSDNGACFVVYQDHKAVYSGSSVSTALHLFTPLFSQAIEQLKRTGKVTTELVFFCIYPDHRVSILGEVSGCMSRSFPNYSFFPMSYAYGLKVYAVQQFIAPESISSHLYSAYIGDTGFCNKNTFCEIKEVSA